MIEILGKKFITDKEASDRYGYSRSWFMHARMHQSGPPYVQISGSKGRVLYGLDECDAWFKERMESKE